MTGGAPSAVVSSTLSSYAAEKAAAAARKVSAWAAAEAEFDAWYRDLGRRAELQTGGNAGMHYGRVLEHAAKCWCGKATAALGLCETHYSVWWRRKNRITRGVRKAAALCHSDRPHHGKGLCLACYTTSDFVRARVRSRQAQRQKYDKFAATPVAPSARAPRLAWECEHTDRRARAFGLCLECWRLRRTLERRAERGTPPPEHLQRWLMLPRQSRPGLQRRRAWQCRHKHRPNYSRGLCKSCWSRWNRLRKRGGRPPEKVQYRKLGIPLLCGCAITPTTKICLGMCRYHYDRWRTEQRNLARARLRKRPSRLPRDVVLCGHPDRSCHARQCCRPCYRVKAWRRPGFGLTDADRAGAPVFPILKTG